MTVAADSSDQDRDPSSNHSAYSPPTPTYSSAEYLKGHPSSWRGLVGEYWLGEGWKRWSAMHQSSPLVMWEWLHQLPHRPDASPHRLLFPRIRETRRRSRSSMRAKPSRARLVQATVPISSPGRGHFHHRRWPTILALGMRRSLLLTIDGAERVPSFWRFPPPLSMSTQIYVSPEYFPTRSLASPAPAFEGLCLPLSIKTTAESGVVTRWIVMPSWPK